MAIQKFVYTKLGRVDLIEMVAQTNLRIGGAYKRAWEIVQQEGHEAFMKELPAAAIDRK